MRKRSAKINFKPYIIFLIPSATTLLKDMTITNNLVLVIGLNLGFYQFIKEDHFEKTYLNKLKHNNSINRHIFLQDMICKIYRFGKTFDSLHKAFKYLILENLF